MDNEPRGPLKRGLHKLSKRFKDVAHGRYRFDPTDRSSSTPPNALQESIPQSGAPAPVQSTQTLPMTGEPIIHQSGKSTESVAESGAPTTVSTQAPTVASHGPTKPSLLAQNINIAAKGTLWALSTAAEGLPIPGAKGIFDAILKVLEVVEVSDVILSGQIC